MRQKAPGLFDYDFGKLGRQEHVILAGRSSQRKQCSRSASLLPRSGEQEAVGDQARERIQPSPRHTLALNTP